jgi:chitinase
MKEHPNEWNIRRDNNESAVIAMRGKEWVSYEDSKTCAAKAKNATTEGFGGIVAYALTNDDFQGDCGGTKYPLLHGINSGLNHEAVKESTPPTEDPKVTHTVTQPTVTDPPGVFRCHQDGKFMDPILCYSYHVCSKTDIAGVWEDEVMHCDRTQGWDNTAQKCINKNLVPGCKK